MGLLDLFTDFRNALFGEEDVLSNRRRQPRIPCQLPVRIRFSRRTELDGEMLDIGVHGMRLRVPKRVYRGQLLTVQTLPGEGVEQRPGLRCRVAWCRQSPAGDLQAGVSYHDTRENLTNSWVHYLILQRNCPIGERKDRRVEAGIPVEVRDEEQHVLAQGLLIDLSLGGAKVSTEDTVPSGTVKLRIGGLDPKMAPIECLGELVGREGRYCRFKFFPQQREQRRLRRLLLSLLDEKRKAKRPRPDTGHAERKPPPAAPQRPRGPLADAVKTGGDGREGILPTWAAETSSQRPLKKDRGFSKFLRSQEIPRKAIPARSPEPSHEPEPVPEPIRPEYLEIPAIWPPRRPIGKGWHPDLETERFRGWARATGLAVAPSRYPDWVERPTVDFWSSVSLGFPGNIPILGLALETGPGAGLALPWASRMALLEAALGQRRPLQWFIGTLRTRERLERRTLSLLERSMHMLSFLGLGGPVAVKSILVSAQVVVNVARELGVEDPAELHQLRLAALLKDVGEAALWMGLQEKSVRDRWGLYLRGLDAPAVDLEDLTSEWQGFRSKAELWCERVAPTALVRELLPLHAWLAQQFLLDQGFPEPLCNWVRAHHENYDGSGYPDGLRGNAIPWQARLLAIADQFAGMIAEGMVCAEGIGSLQYHSNRIYDGSLVTALHRYLQRMNLI